MTRLETERLLLRPPEARDAPAIAHWVKDFDVARNLSTAPHPYTQEDALRFIRRVSEQAVRGKAHCFAIVRKDDWRLIGCAGLYLKDGRYEMGYWLGKPFWNRGYCSEAAGRVLTFAFQELKAAEVFAGWFHDNPASGRVLEKLGFRPDGAAPRACLARGHDVHCHMATLTAAEFGQRKASFAARAPHAEVRREATPRSTRAGTSG